MLLELFKEPPPYLLTSMGGGPYKGEKPASEGTGQAEACLARPAITAQNSGHKKAPAACGYGAVAPRTTHGFSRPATGLTVTGAL
ncbi:hypothetical protein D3C84_1174760 [compost metagenome]